MFAACGIMHRRCCQMVPLSPAGNIFGAMSPAGNIFGALYHKLQTQSSAPEDGRNYRPKYVELIEITNKLLLLHLVGCLYYFIRDARSHKHQNYYIKMYRTAQNIILPGCYTEGLLHAPATLHIVTGVLMPVQ